MSVENAKSYYLGKDGCKKSNCAEAVAHAFKDKFNMTDEEIALFARWGGGQSPEGQCGSLYAAKVMLEKKYPEQIKVCESVFLSTAGSLKCKDIRSLKKLSCLGCVEKAGEFLDQIDDSGGQIIKDKSDLSGGDKKIIDACGLQCPGPIMLIKQAIDQIQFGETIEIAATDPAFPADVRAWCQSTGNELVNLKLEHGRTIAIIRKKEKLAVAGTPVNGVLSKTIVVFSSDFDKVIASFVIATGAAAMGSKVTMFFTFWGLNVLRRSESVPVKKNLVEQMFGWMMPRGADKLSLSKMNMSGAGTWMIKEIMKKKNISSLPEFMLSAKQSGVRLVACTMSMDLMGIKPEELIEGVEFGGVATYLEQADQGNVNLFI
ncbi:MAG: DsrE/DsrF/DrsH-like family protein [Candidatus Omnitrophica bacterium]|nr:DsrE/DsrF/DrsH-like family protein [Candidatus Omnitrophota bacterium]